MYRIIGGDGKEYGPIPADDLRRWIAEGRLNAQSLAASEGAPDWRPLGTFPEFAAILGLQERPQFPTFTGQALPPAGLVAWRAEILARQSQVRIGHCLVESAKLLFANFGLIAGATALYWLIQTVCQVNVFASILYWVFNGVFLGGLCLIYLKRIRGQAATLGDLFSGFSIAFFQLLLAGLVSGLLSFVAFCCLILPGIYLLVAWTFSIPLVADKRLEFWTAMELSRKIVTRVWFEMFAILVIPLLPLLGLYLFESVKTFSTLFPTLLDTVRAGGSDPGRLAELIRHASQTSPAIEIARQLVLLLVLPFAIGARMFAYEDLFGTRSAPKP